MPPPLESCKLSTFTATPPQSCTHFKDSCTHTLMGHHMGARSLNLRLSGKYFWLVSYTVSPNYSTLPLVQASSHRQYVHEWVQLGANKTLFTITSRGPALANGPESGSTTTVGSLREQELNHVIDQHLDQHLAHRSCSNTWRRNEKSPQY